MIALCGRDRRELVERCLTSLHAHGPDEPVLFWLDPACTEYHAAWLLERGVDQVHRLALPDALEARQRVARMRWSAARMALERGERILFLDSDVELRPDFRARLEELWAAREALGAGCVGLAAWPGYRQPRHLIREVPEFGAYLTSHALGAALLVPADFRLERALEAGCPMRGSWDSILSERLSPVLSPDRAPLVHLGSGTGISAARGRKALELAC